MAIGVKPQSEGLLSSAEESLATTRQTLAILSEGCITWVLCPAPHFNDVSISFRQDFLNSVRTLNKSYTSSVRRGGLRGRMDSLWPVGATPRLSDSSMAKCSPRPPYTHTQAGTSKSTLQVHKVQDLYEPRERLAGG